MPKPYSVDLRARVIEEVETGASRREAAERYGLSPSVVVIWVQRFEETGSIAAKSSGGSTSPLERHAEFLLGLIGERPDMTLDEIVAAMRKRRIAGSRSAVWRVFNRRAITVASKKLCTRRSRSERRGARLPGFPRWSSGGYISYAFVFRHRVGCEYVLHLCRDRVRHGREHVLP